MGINEIKERILHLLLQKGFKYRYYEVQNSNFYTKEIIEPAIVKWFVKENCGLEESFDLTGVSIIIEIRDNFENAQYRFLNGHGKQYIIDDLMKFKELVEKLPNQIELR